MDKRVLAAVAVLAAAVFVADRMLPPGVSASVLYVLPILLASGLRSARAVWAVAAACLAATAADLLLEIDSGGAGALWLDHALASAAELAAATLVSRRARLADSNERLSKETIKLRERLDMINRIGQVFASTLDLENIYLAIREMLDQIIDCESLLVSFYNPEDQTIRCAFAYTDGEIVPVEKFEPLKLGTGPQSQCIRTARPVIVDNIVTRHPGKFRYVGHTDRNPLAILYVPMIAEERVIGVIQAQSTREGAYTEEDVPLLSIIANQAASAILNARLYKDAVEGRLAMERANRMKDEFLATLSHELRTPLTPILGWTQILARIPPDDRETFLHAIQVIERNAKFQTRLVNDLLDMSRIESGKLLIAIQPSDLNAAVASVVDSLRNEAMERGIEITTSLGAGRITVSADPARLEQIINNLLMNALKFTDEGGRVTVSTERRKDSAVLVCTDTGIGIEPDFLPYVFERFRQADSSTRRRHSGLGLGLSIVKSLIDMHGGKVEARSDGPGHGSTFIVEMPLAATGPLDSAAAGPADAKGAALDRKGELAGLRVLLVEDDMDTLGLMRALCEEQGLSVIEARAAEEALETLKQLQPDLIISDISLPDMDGLELVRRLRADARFREMPMIALSGLVTDEDQERARAAGFDMHLSKPVAYETLSGALNDLLKTRTV